MKKLILLFMIPMLVGISQVSAETGAVIAVDDTAITNEDVAVEVDVLDNDAYDGTGTLIVESISNFENWTWEITAWGVTFTPDSDFNWQWSFDYVVSDWVLSDTWSVVITVEAVNDWPVAFDDAADTDQGEAVEINLTANDTDVDADDLTVVSISGVDNWTVVINDDEDGIIFTPNSTLIWVERFTYTIEDGNGWTDTATVEVTVTEEDENNAPEAEDDTLETDENTTKTIDPRDNDDDEDDDDLEITWVTEADNGEVEFTSTTVTYTPDDGYYGDDSFTYTIEDWNGWTDTATVEITITEEDEEINNNYTTSTTSSSVDKHRVRDIQKRYIAALKALKIQYRGQMSSKAYFDAKKQVKANTLAEIKGLNAWDDEEYVEKEVKTKKVKKIKYKGNSTKDRYKDTFETTYWKTISDLSEDRKITVVERIDALMVDINDWGYSEETQAKFNTVLIALRELVVEYMDDPEDVMNLDALFDF